MTLEDIKKAMGSSVCPWLVSACFSGELDNSRLRANVPIAAKIKIIVAVLPCLM
jgi:hypothetical protein